LPERMALHSARNGRPGVQIVVQTDGAETLIRDAPITL
jgi:hypothetical protein